MRVNRRDHLRNGALHQFPEGSCCQGIADLVGMEPIHRLYQLPGLASLSHPLVDGCLDWGIDVVDLEVVESLVGHEVPKGLVELHGSLRGDVAPGLVGVHPAKAGRYLKAVEIVIEGSISDVIPVRPNRVYAVMERVEQDAAVHQAIGNDDGAGWDVCVQVAKRLEVVGVELLWGSHVINVRVPTAHVITHELKHDEHRVVGLVPREALHNVLGHGPRPCPIDGNVLVVPVVAPVELSHPQVGGVHGPTDATPGGVGVGRGAGEHGPVQLILEDEEDVLEGLNADVLAGHPLRWDVEMGPHAVAKDGRSHLPRPFAQLRLVGLSRVRIRPVYPVAVGVHEGVVCRVPAGVDGGVHVRAVLTAPRGAAKRVQVREVVAVDVVHWEVVIAEPFEDLAYGLHHWDVAEVRKPGTPLGGGGSFLGGFDPLLGVGGREGEQVTHLPRGLRAHAYPQAHDIGGFLVFQHFDDLGAVVIDQHDARLLKSRG